MSRPGAPPPLPPKTRRGAAATTVLAAANQDVASASPSLLPEAQPAGEPATTICSDDQNRHVVKIRVNTGGDISEQIRAQSLRVPVVGYSEAGGCVRISVGGGGSQDMVRRVAVDAHHPADRGGNAYFFCNGLPCAGATTVISSGQSSPSDTLDSGTCSDLDGGTPPPPPPKKRPSAAVTVTVNGGGGRRERAGSLSSGAEVDDSDDDDRISCDSLNSGSVSHPGSDELFDAPARYETKATITLVNSGAICIGQQVSDAKTNLHQVAGLLSEGVTDLSGDDDHPSDDQTPKGRLSILSNGDVPCGDVKGSGGGLPRGLLQDIRERTSKLSISPSAEGAPAKKTRVWGDDLKLDTLRKPILAATPQTDGGRNHQPLSPRTSSSSSCSADEAAPRKSGSIVEERTYEDRRKESEEKEKMRNGGPLYDMDMFYKFHINESFEQPEGARPAEDDGPEDSFAGYKDLMEGKQASATIRSAKGTVRGVKNRVRAGITTFLQLQTTKLQSYKEKEAGKVVLYSTTMGVVRRTYQDCVKVKKILRNLMVKYEERDVFMSREVQAEIRDRMSSDLILVPQMFVEGQLVGDAEAVEKLNESGELRRFLKPYRSPDACSECRVCGGHRLLPCPVCNGSKKSVHRNHFTAEFVALKCMNCDEVGLVRCHAC